jgi:hypothetical protein
MDWNEAQPPIQRVPGTLSLGVRRQGREVDRSPPTSAEVKNVDLYIPPPVRFQGVVLDYLSTGTTLPFFTLSI